MSRREVLIIGSGIAGMTCAVRCAEQGMHATLVSPFPSERAQSVMAAGGINAVLPEGEAGDSVACHVEDTLRGGSMLGGARAVGNLCAGAAEIIRWLEGIGTVFSLDDSGRPARRAFGGQTHKRTYYCGASTGKQIVSALVMEVRRYEAAGLITRRLGLCFHSALIRDGVCRGAIFFDEATWRLEALTADATVLATGGQNALFGKTTGSTQCDGYAAGKLFLQGAELKNLEFIQYHPTTMETAQKRMLISEAARGEGGRLFYTDGGRRVYFLEDKYGPKGNLMTRDVISREMEAAGREIWLDLTCLGKDVINERLPEVRDLCAKYRGIDVSREPIPVAPSVHFFMGGLAVHLNHETNISGLFAVGECASMYHGANRLGGNSLLSAIYGAGVAAREIAGREALDGSADFSAQLQREQALLDGAHSADSPFSVMVLRDMLAETMRKHLGIVRDAQKLSEGLHDVEYYLSVADRLRYDGSVLPYFNYSLTGILTLAQATLRCALARQESRGAHCRSDFSEQSEEFAYATLISWDGGKYSVRQDREKSYES